MKKLVCILIISTTTVAVSFAQIKNIDKRIAELKATGVDTLITYYPYSYGYQYDLLKVGTCQSFSQKYLIWIKGGRSFIQLFDECYTYNTFPFDAKEVIEIVKGYFSEIRNEEIKPVQYKTIDNGKETTATTMVTHANQLSFEFFIQSEVVKKQIDGYDLNTQYAESTILNKGETGYNINYTYNQNTYLNRIKNIIEEKLRRLGSKR